MNTEHTTDQPVPALMALDADLIHQLAHRYVEYRQALDAPADPVRVLSLTGDVLTAVRRVITAPTHDLPHAGQGTTGTERTGTDRTRG